MSILNSEIEKLFELSKIKLDQKAIPEVARKLSFVLELVDQIRKVDCSNVQPLAVLVEKSDSIREDEPLKISSKEDLFANLPASEREYAIALGYYRVPNVMSE